MTYGTVAIFLQDRTNCYPYAFCTAAGDYYTVCVGRFPHALVVGDFNGDGYPDLAVTNVNEGTASILLNDGTGTLSVFSTPSVGNKPHAIVAADYNSDGYLDLAITDGGEMSHTVFLFPGNGDGTFGSEVTCTGSPCPTVGAMPVSMALGNLGYTSRDLAVANLNDDHASILHPVFTTGLTFVNGPDLTLTDANYNTPTDVAIADFDGDSNPDVAVTNFRCPPDTGPSCTYVGAVQIFFGKGDGTYDGSEEVFLKTSTDYEPRKEAVGDFNLNGHPDIATANVQSNTISLLIQ